MIQTLRDWFEGSDLLAGSALVISLVALIRPWIVEHRQNRIADVRVYLEISQMPFGTLGTRPAQKRLVFHNAGKAIARNVTVVNLESVRGEGVARILNDDLPISEIDPGLSVSVPIGFHDGARAGGTITYSWSDDRGAHQRTRPMLPGATSEAS